MVQREVQRTMPSKRRDRRSRPSVAESVLLGLDRSPEERERAAEHLEREQAERQWLAFFDRQDLEAFRRIEAIARETHAEGLDAYTRQTKIVEALDEHLGLKPGKGRRRGTWPRDGLLLAFFKTNTDMSAAADPGRTLKENAEKAVELLGKQYPGPQRSPTRPPGHPGA